LFSSPDPSKPNGFDLDPDVLHGDHPLRCQLRDTSRPLLDKENTMGWRTPPSENITAPIFCHATLSGAPGIAVVRVKAGSGG
jgi:hypothetical protein